MATRRVVIVGGGGTGDYAAFTLRKQGFDGEITILSADSDRPYDRPYLSKEFLRGEIERPKVFLHDERDYTKERIELRLGERVTGGSLQERKLFVEDGADLAFDVLVLGLGGTPRRLPEIPTAENVLTLRSLHDSQAIRESLGRSSRLLLIGAGFIGAEVAASARRGHRASPASCAGPVDPRRALGGGQRARAGNRSRDRRRARALHQASLFLVRPVRRQPRIPRSCVRR